MFGLAGTCVAFLFQVLDQSSLDRPLVIALYCFVVSIPLLVSLAVTADIASSYSHSINSERAMFTLMPLFIAPSIAAFGLGSYLWHYSVGAAVAFVTALILGFVLFMRFQSEVLPQQTADAASSQGPHPNQPSPPE